jgi:hypothetical protein
VLVHRAIKKAKMSVRTGLRLSSSAFRQIRTPFQQHTRQQIFRRGQTTAATEKPPQQSLFQRLWTSEVGIKTVHFW